MIRRIATWGGIVATLACVLSFRWRMIPYTSFDLQHFIIGWYDELEAGGWRALRVRFADYNVPYLYLLWLASLVFDNGLVAIKVISNLGDLALAWGVFRIVAGFRGRGWGSFAALLTLLLPGVWLNSAVWGQTDQLWAALAVHAVADLLRSRTTPSRQIWAWAWFGLAVAVKLQAIFVAPFLIVIWLRDRRRSWSAPPVAVLAWAAAAVPALLIGLPWRELLRTYSEQTSASRNATVTTNLWQLFSPQDPDFVAAITAFAAAVTGALMVGALVRRRWFADPERWVVLAATFALLLPYTLPGMRNRYFFLAEVLIVVAALLRPKLWPVALTMSIMSVLGYSRALFGRPFPLGDVASGIPFAVLLVVLIRDALGVSDSAADLPAETQGRGEVAAR